MGEDLFPPTPLFLLLFPLSGLEKERVTKRKGGGEEDAKLEYWKVRIAETGTEEQNLACCLWCHKILRLP